MDVGAQEMEKTEYKINELKETFENTSSWDERYKKIIEMGKKLPSLNKEDKKPELLVKGCQSQVWLKAGFSDGKLNLQGESDSVIVQGLLSLLIYVYSDQTPDDVLSTSPIFLEELGLKKHLTPNRSNGVYAMLKQILYYAQAFQLLAKKS